jgi:DNA-binding GntR family transcriptional regulator
MSRSSLEMTPLCAHTQNAILRILRDEFVVGQPLLARNALAKRCGTSRTTIHRVLADLVTDGLLKNADGILSLQRNPADDDFLPEPENLSRVDEVEGRIMEKLAAGGLRPGMQFSELELAREFGVTTVTIREALLRLVRLGAFKKPARKQWQVVRIDRRMLDELMDLRVLHETYALERCFRDLTSHSPFFRKQLEDTKALASSLQPDGQLFLALDDEFHRQIIIRSGNRYLIEGFEFVSFLIRLQFFQQHLPAIASMRAVNEHVGMLEAIVAGDLPAALSRLRLHLDAARDILHTLQEERA